MYDDALEPFSEESKEAFAAATQELIAQLENYLDIASQMRGQDSESDQLSEMNVEIDEVIRHWNATASEHTGTPVLMLDGEEDELDEEFEDFDEDDEESSEDADDGDEAPDEIDGVDPTPGGDPAGEDEGNFDDEATQMSVVGRWDLNIVDESQLLEVAREIRRHGFPAESDLEIEEAIATAAQALETIGQDFGNPWLDLDGTEIHQATTLYVMPDEPFEEGPSDTDDEPTDEELSEDDLLQSVEVPAGEILASEKWG